MGTIERSVVDYFMLAISTSAASCRRLLSCGNLATWHPHEACDRKCQNLTTETHYINESPGTSGKATNEDC